MPVLYFRADGDEGTTTSTKTSSTLTSDQPKTTTSKADNNEETSTKSKPSSTERVVVAAETDSSKTTTSSRTTSARPSNTVGAIDDASMVKQTCTDEGSSLQQCTDASSDWVKNHPEVFAAVAIPLAILIFFVVRRVLKKRKEKRDHQRAMELKRVEKAPG